jgi:hypothetical protein
LGTTKQFLPCWISLSVDYATSSVLTLGFLSAQIWMKVLLASFISLLATAALAQPDDGIDQRTAQAEIPKTDDVPTGGCMPIGLTARGDLVFPMQCRELRERQRGPIPEDQPTARAPEQLPQLAPSVKITRVAKGKDSASADQPRERTHKKELSNAERRKKQALSPNIDPETTGSTKRE